MDLNSNYPCTFQRTQITLQIEGTDPHRSGTKNIFSLSSTYEVDGRLCFYSCLGVNRGRRYPLISGPKAPGGEGVFPSPVTGPVESSVPGPALGWWGGGGVLPAKVKQEDFLFEFKFLSFFVLENRPDDKIH